MLAFLGMLCIQSIEVSNMNAKQLRKLEEKVLAHLKSLTDEELLDELEVCGPFSEKIDPVPSYEVVQNTWTSYNTAFSYFAAPVSAFEVLLREAA